jgi:hypothetical protein
VWLAACAVAALAVVSTPANAVMVDLTQGNTSGSVATFYGTAYFTNDTTQPAGTGVFEPFLTIQHNGVEEGYNSSNQQAPFDVKRVPQWNHEFTVGEMKANASVTIGNDTYYRFLIDINEPNATNAHDEKPLISLDRLKMFTSSTAGQTTYNVESLGVKRFDLDLNPSGVFSNSFVLYDDRNNGSGQADIAFLIPSAAFASAANSDYVYMYQMFGEQASADIADVDNSTEGGYEETRFGGVNFGPVPVIPEVSTLCPLGAMLFMACGGRRFRRGRRVPAHE